MPDSSTPVEVFYSYAHKDETFRNKLETHLSLLQRQGLLTAWHDRQRPVDWNKAPFAHLQHSRLVPNQSAPGATGMQPSRMWLQAFVG